MSANRFQNALSKVHAIVKLGLHTGQTQKKPERPLRLLVTGRASNDETSQLLSERTESTTHKNNLNSVSVSSAFFPAVNLSVENIQAGSRCKGNVHFTFHDVKYLMLAQIVGQISPLQLSRID